MLTELGITSIRIDLPFRLNHINCFIAQSEDGWTVIDTGLHNKETVAIWDEFLTGKKVTDILISHYHPDHFGYAGGLQQKTGARVSMSEIDKQSGMTVWEENFTQGLRHNYKLAGVPMKTASEMSTNTVGFSSVITPYPKVDHYFEEGEKIQIGRCEYEVIFTPGHSDGLVVFYNREKSVLISTDHILPNITPNVAYWFHGIKNPLESYITSLKKIKKLDVEYVIPSHGDPFHHANKRIDEIIIHHEERLDFVMNEIANGVTVYSICKKLFDKDMDVHEMRFALGETLAHLEYLRYDGQLKREIIEGEWRYYLI
ncbi:MBL fold metallo-hydrolase [Sporosarcina sp. 179-K 3D1 HS]|uniref:MBL fold metallo-hydrolase n=1 Tax=Sporosarcina sp. 179-K 3D1 HS TaxID=3232169 RepID=UPI00399F3A46